MGGRKIGWLRRGLGGVTQCVMLVRALGVRTPERGDRSPSESEDEMTSVTCPNCNSGHQIPDEARAFRCPTCAADVRYHEQAPMRPPPPGWQPGWYAGQGSGPAASTSPQAAGKGEKPIWKRSWVWVVGIILV